MPTSAQRDEDFRYWLARFDGDSAVPGVWTSAILRAMYNEVKSWLDLVLSDGLS